MVHPRTVPRTGEGVTPAEPCDPCPFPLSHRDIKGMNVFLTKDLHAKLADFDFLLEIPEGVVVNGLCGTPGYIAPEMFTGDYDHRCDIWSYGSLLYEITHGAFPFSKETVDEDGIPLPPDEWMAAVEQATVQGCRPTLDPDICPAPMMKLIQDCWETDTDRRPTAAQIVKRLNDMEADFE